MTVPAPTLLPRAATPNPAAGPAAGPAAAGAASGADMPGFAAHLTREAAPPGMSPRSAPALPAISALAVAADFLGAGHPGIGGTAGSLAETNPAEPGKNLPLARHKPAAMAIAAAPLLIAASAPGEAAVKALDPETGPAAAAQLAARSETDLAALVLALPGAMLAPLVPAASAVNSSAAPATAPQTAAPFKAPDSGQVALPSGEKAAAAAGTQAAHPAAFAITGLVLEREAAAGPAFSAPSPDQNTPDQTISDAAQQAATRAQPSTLAALTGASEAERITARKPRTEAEAVLPAGKAAEAETAGALAFTQPPSSPAAAPASALASSVLPASGPQPISFDQLVDSIARARDGVEPSGPVAVAMHHGEFGRVSLSIESDGTGLSVALASADPAFTQAAAAAHAAAHAASGTEAARPAAPGASTDPRGEAGARGPDQGGGQGGTQGSASGQSGQHREAQRSDPQRAPIRPQPRGETAAGDERRSGIFA